MLGTYRNVDASDPKLFVSALAAVLAEYSEEVVTCVTDPRHGIASELKWVPSVAELRACCEREAARQDRINRYRALPAPCQRERAVSGGATRTALCAQYGLDAIPNGMDATELAQLAAKHGQDLPAVLRGMADRAPAKGSLAAALERLVSTTKH